jgi:hypothetical protein
MTHVYHTQQILAVLRLSPLPLTAIELRAYLPHVHPKSISGSLSTFVRDRKVHVVERVRVPNIRLPVSKFRFGPSPLSEPETASSERNTQIAKLPSAQDERRLRILFGFQRYEDARGHLTGRLL